MTKLIYTIEPINTDKEQALIIKVEGKPKPEKLAIPFPQVLETFKKMAGTGRFIFNNKELVIDLFSRVEFYYHVDAQTKVSGRLTFRDQDFSIKECDFICQGPPHWFIKGISLKFVHPDVTWKELKKAQQNQLTLEDSDETSKIIYEGNSQEILAIQNDPLPILKLKDRFGAFADLYMDYGKGELFSFQEKITQRNRKIEVENAWEKDLLETNFLRKPMSNSHYYCPSDKVGKSLAFLLEIGWKIFDWKDNRIWHQQDISLSVDENKKDLLIHGKIKYEDYEANLSDVVGAFNRKERFVELSPGNVGLLDQAPFNTLIEECEIVSDGIKMKRNKIGLLDDFPFLSSGQSLVKTREKLQSFKGIETKSPGKDFKGSLRPYQQAGLNWLSFLYEYGFHGILADDMGLGKTVQVLAFLSQLSLTQPVLIVLPTSLLFNWKKEFEQFIPGWEVILHHGAQRRKEIGSHPHIILTTYNTLRIDLSLFSSINFQCVILDEAQMIKNAHTQIAQAIFSLRSDFRLSITGTPIENHLGEIWSQFHFLMPDLLGEETEFTTQIESAAVDFRYLQRIKKKIRPFILRRKKEEVAKDLPEKIEQVVWIEMEPEQRKIYDEFLSGVKNQLIQKVNTEGLSKNRMEVLEAILRLRQICCHPWLVSAQAPSNKLEALLADIETAIDEGRKILVFSQFTSMLTLIGKEIKEKGWKFLTLDGSTTNREKVVTQFQEDSTIPLFLISLKAGGVGLNLTAADYVFLYDPWWNEAVENQAINRAHRIGRKETVIAKRYVMLESIEEKIMTLKTLKRNLVSDLLDLEKDSTALTEEDLKFLLS